MDLASAEAEIRHVFGDTPITEASIGAAPPDILVKLSGTNAHKVRIALCKIIMAEWRNVFEEEKGEGTSSKGPTSSEVSPEVEHPATKKRACASRDMYYLWERRFLVFIRQGRGTVIGVYTVILALYGHVDNIAMNIEPCYY